jgi:hypothetical protein
MYEYIPNFILQEETKVDQISDCFDIDVGISASV